MDGIESAGADREVSDLSEARIKIANLETALLNSRRIGAAIGVIMATRKVTYEQAFALLREGSQVTHRKLRELADDVLLTGAFEHLAGRPVGHHNSTVAVSSPPPAATAE